MNADLIEWGVALPCGIVRKLNHLAKLRRRLRSQVATQTLVRIVEQPGHLLTWLEENRKREEFSLIAEEKVRFHFTPEQFKIVRDFSSKLGLRVGRTVRLAFEYFAEVNGNKLHAA